MPGQVSGETQQPDLGARFFAERTNLREFADLCTRAGPLRPALSRRGV